MVSGAPPAGRAAEGRVRRWSPEYQARLGRRRGSHVPRELRWLGICGRERALSALPETGGDACEYFDPLVVADMAAATGERGVVVHRTGVQCGVVLEDVGIDIEVLREQSPTAVQGRPELWQWSATQLEPGACAPGSSPACLTPAAQPGRDFGRRPAAATSGRCGSDYHGFGSMRLNGAAGIPPRTL